MKTRTKPVRTLQNVMLIVMLVAFFASAGQLRGAKAFYCSGLSCDEYSECGGGCYCGRGTCYDIMQEQNPE